MNVLEEKFALVDLNKVNDTKSKLIWVITELKKCQNQIFFSIDLREKCQECMNELQVLGESQWSIEPNTDENVLAVRMGSDILREVNLIDVMICAYNYVVVYEALEDCVRMTRLNHNKFTYSMSGCRSFYRVELATSNPFLDSHIVDLGFLDLMDNVKIEKMMIFAGGVLQNF